MTNDIDRIPEEWREWWEERAAILEYDAQYSRGEAEKEATRLVVALLDIEKEFPL
jgi:hypothetical protein